MLVATRPRHQQHNRSERYRSQIVRTPARWPGLSRGRMSRRWAGSTTSFHMTPIGVHRMVDDDDQSFPLLVREGT
jgi:hypothetical protein